MNIIIPTRYSFEPVQLTQASIKVSRNVLHVDTNSAAVKKWFTAPFAASQMTKSAWKELDFIRWRPKTKSLVYIRCEGRFVSFAPTNSSWTSVSAKLCRPSTALKCQSPRCWETCNHRELMQRMSCIERRIMRISHSVKLKRPNKRTLRCLMSWRRSNNKRNRKRKIITNCWRRKIH